jgi:outer membrane lipoprotein-sorting protein
MFVPGLGIACLPGCLFAVSEDRVRIPRVILFMLAILPASVGYAELPDGEGVMDKVTAAFRGMRDLSTDVEVSTANRQASGRIVLQYVWERPAKNDAPEKVVRKYIVETRVGTPQGIVTVKQVSDGLFLWIEKKVGGTGQVTVTRQKTTSEGPIPGGFGPDWRKEIDHWRWKYVFQTLRADTVDAQQVLVVEGVRRDDADDPDAKRYPDLSSPGRILLFVSLQDDFPRRVDLFAAKPQDPPAKTNDGPVVSVKFMHVHLNEGLDPETFHYTVPPGAEFIDED